MKINNKYHRTKQGVIKRNQKPFNIKFAHLGNGMVVFDTNRIQNNDYKTIAHIRHDRTIRWNVKRLPEEIRQIIIEYAKTANPNISQTQSEKVFDKRR